MLLCVCFILVISVLVPVPVTASPLNNKHYDFIPELLTIFTPHWSPDDKHIFSWRSRCSRLTTASFSSISTSQIAVEVSASKGDFACIDTYLLVSQLAVHVREVSHKGTVHWKFLLSPEESHDVSTNGLFLFHSTQSATQLLKDLYHTIRLFTGRGTDKENLDFIKNTLNITLTPRNISPSAFDTSLLRPGDVIIESDAVSGVSGMISFGTNSFAGHCAVVLSLNGKLHVAESTLKADGSKAGFVIEDWDSWLASESANKYEAAVLLRLSPQNSAKFNNTAAVNWFLENEGTPYGQGNFIFSWLNTENANYPGKWSWNFLLVLLELVEKVAPGPLHSVILEGISHRLGQTVSSIRETVNVLVERGDMNFGELLAIPERVDWTYDGQRQLVCSSFVVEVLRQGGIFGGDLFNDIIPQEFSPRDLLQLGIYEEHLPNKPFYCGMPGTSMCQIFGSYHYPELKYFNTIKPYPKMNFYCPLNRTPDMYC
ncbi:hypothetical protein P9112_004009 [Eukaryota sp. TZLM1-RC]